MRYSYKIWGEVSSGSAISNLHGLVPHSSREEWGKVVRFPRQGFEDSGRSIDPVAMAKAIDDAIAQHFSILSSAWIEETSIYSSIGRKTDLVKYFIEVRNVTDVPVDFEMRYVVLNG
jgi:hypothetical protein